MNKLILTDADGVLLDWSKTFNDWATKRGYTEVISGQYDVHLSYDISKAEAKRIIKEFNESSVICQLPPFRDAVFWVKRITEELGYRFRVITSLSLCPYAGKARDINLKHLFGDSIESLICLDTGASKYKALLPYKDSGMVWIEDKPLNALDGHNLGLRSYLMEHDHNLDYGDELPDKILRVKNWNSIYSLIRMKDNM